MKQKLTKLIRNRNKSPLEILTSLSQQLIEQDKLSKNTEELNNSVNLLDLKIFI